MRFVQVVSLFLDLLWNIIYQNVQNRIPYRIIAIVVYSSLMGIFFILSEVIYMRKAKNFYYMRICWQKMIPTKLDAIIMFDILAKMS